MNSFFSDQQHENTDFAKEPFLKGEYENCLFKNCNFSNANLSESRFLNCEFTACNLSLTVLAKTAFQQVKFKDCKMLGLHFEHCNDFGLSFNFDNCLLNHSSFYQMKLKKMVFKNSSLQEVDFAECDLTDVIFANCDLLKASFENTILEKADFRTSFNYLIDPEKNKIKRPNFRCKAFPDCWQNTELKLNSNVLIANAFSTNLYSSFITHRLSLKNMNPVSVRNVSKKYGKIEALKGVSFEVENSEIFGIIGPDGAGKTTLFRILTTLLLPNEGTAFVDGRNVVKEYKQVRNIVGYMPGRFSLYQDLTVEENLNFFATVFNTTVEENYDLIKDIYQQIEPFKTRHAGKLSGGMKQKLALSCALIHKPTVLFLDEPTTGVDPVSRKEFWEMLRRLKNQGITILVSTPYMDEASLCDRIGLIQNGKFLQIDTPQNIVNQFTAGIWAIQSNQMSKLLRDLRANPMVKTCFSFGNVHHITIENEQLATDNENDKMKLLQTNLEKLGHKEVVIKEIKPTIEDCFMELSSNSK